MACELRQRLTSLFFAREPNDAQKVSGSPSELSRCRALLGTYVEVHLNCDQVCDYNALVKISQAAFARIEYIHAAMSFHQEESELSRLNKSAHLTAQTISPELAEVIATALDISQRSDGVFDITIAPALIEQGLLPDHQAIHDNSASWEDIELSKQDSQHQVFFCKPLQIDLGGIAKGYAVDQALKAAEQLAADLGIDDISITINAGGDLRSNRWQQETVQLRHPNNPQHLTPYLMQNAAVATSAGYFIEQGSALINPSNGQPNEVQHSVSVFAESCILADALTKVALLHPKPDAILAHYNAQLLPLH